MAYANLEEQMEALRNGVPSAEVFANGVAGGMFTPQPGQNFAQSRAASNAHYGMDPNANQFQGQIDKAFGSFQESPFKTYAQRTAMQQRPGATANGEGTHLIQGPNGQMIPAPGTYGSRSGVISQLQGQQGGGGNIANVQDWLRQYYGGASQGGGYAGTGQGPATPRSMGQQNAPWAAGATSQVPSFNGYTPTNGWNNRPSQGWDGWNTQGQTGGGLAGAVNNTGSTPANKGSRGGFYVGAPTGPRRTY